MSKAGKFDFEKNLPVTKKGFDVVVYPKSAAIDLAPFIHYFELKFRVKKENLSNFQHLRTMHW
jgi:hypothetical protein